MVQTGSGTLVDSSRVTLSPGPGPGSAYTALNPTDLYVVNATALNHSR